MTVMWIIVACMVLLCVATGIASYKTGYNDGIVEGVGKFRSHDFLVKELSSLVNSQSTRLVESQRQAMDMASVIPENQIDRINASRLADARHDLDNASSAEVGFDYMNEPEPGSNNAV